MTTKTWSIIGIVGVVGVVSAISLYQAGRRSERAESRAKVRQDSLKYVTEQLRLNARVLAAEHRTTLAEAAKDSALRVRRAVARGKIRVLSDTAFQVVTVDSAGAVVDSGGPTYAIPEVVALVRTDDSLTTQSATTQGTLAAELQTLYRRDALHTTGERLRDETIAETTPQRCGRRCGVVAGFTAGVTVTLAVTHPVESVRLVTGVVRWVARRF